jgi:hypothetical protein
VTIAVVGPGLGLLGAVLTDSSPIDWLEPAILTIFGAALLTTGIILANPESKPRGTGLAVLVALCCAYGYGAGLEINALFDRGTVQSFPVRVLSKRSQHYVRSLAVEPWGPNESDDEITVRWSLYSHVHSGDIVCVQLHPGALDMAWYAASLCPVDSLK